MVTESKMRRQTKDRPTSQRPAIRPQGEVAPDVVRRDDASIGMIEAHVADLLTELGLSDSASYGVSCAVVRKLRELEADGYLIMLRKDTCCSHCGR